LEEGFVCGNFLRSASSSDDDFFDDATFYRNVDLDGGGEMLAMLPSLNASGAGMGFLNQSMVPGGIKYLVSTTCTWGFD
jgi:hypothetical protein